MATQVPPAYEAEDTQLSLPEHDLPAYDGPAPASDTAAAARTAARVATRAFTYQLKHHTLSASADNAHRWWAQLTLNGNDKLSSATEPTILQGTPVSGSVQLDLQSLSAGTDSVHAVHLTVRGQTQGGNPDGIGIPAVFLEIKKELWTRNAGTAGENPGPQGEQSLPFAIDLPSEIIKQGKAYPLPASFGTELGYFTVEYHVELRVVRSMFHLGSDKLHAKFKYFALTTAAAPSPLRALAYQENSPLLGPDADPDGWASKVFSIKGRAFASRDVDIQVKISLAKPFSYTRATSIPVAMSIESTDAEVVDLLSAPRAPILILECTTQQNALNYHTTSEVAGQAVWWTVPGQPKGHLMGEIHLKSSLYPSTDFAPYGFRVLYSLVFFPFQAPGFKQTGEIEPIKGSRQVVDITTSFASGPRPKTYSHVPLATEASAKNEAVAAYYCIA
uniref:Arrestin-like N-terminal domain-containing protein n=1 Tax=Mycena chlorophos TaxID=658473 RepID=A0ABQ0MB69_MYCCL|nr:predicted protein [Mycena chlorophos]